MMFRLVLTTLIICLFGIQKPVAQQLSVEKVRDQFFSMSNSEDGALKLFKSLEKADLAKNPILLAYRGASSAASAGSVSGVRKKIEYFNNGKEEIEKAVKLKPLDAEIRFLRLATQVSAPGFLGYTGDIKADKEIIIMTLGSTAADHPNAYLYQRICSFMLKYVKLNPTEKSTVSQFVVKFTPKQK